MNDIQILTITFAVMTCVWVFLFSLIFYICGKQKGVSTKKEELYAPVIKQILGEMYIDESGNNVLDGVTDEERKWLEDKLSELMFEFHQKIGLNPGWFKVVSMEEVNLNDYRSTR